MESLSRKTAHFLHVCVFVSWVSHSTSIMTTSTEKRRSLCAAGTTVRGSRSPSKPSTCWWFTCADTRGRNHTSARWVMERPSLGSALSKRPVPFCTKRRHFSPVWQKWTRLHRSKCFAAAPFKLFGYFSFASTSASSPVFSLGQKSEMPWFPSLVPCSLKAVQRHTPALRTWKPICARTLVRNRTCANTKDATRHSPMPQTEQNTKTGHTPMR